MSYSLKGLGTTAASDRAAPNATSSMTATIDEGLPRPVLFGVGIAVGVAGAMLLGGMGYGAWRSRRRRPASDISWEEVMARPSRRRRR